MPCNMQTQIINGIKQIFSLFCVSNYIIGTKDLFLLCEGSALFQQVSRYIFLYLFLTLYNHNTPVSTLFRPTGTHSSLPSTTGTYIALAFVGSSFTISSRSLTQATLVTNKMS